MSMDYREMQEKEIATIKERTITLNLSDADVKRICEKAGRGGLTVSQLLQNFIGDLVCGTYSNGSDERDFAQQWFERCWFGVFPDRIFTQHAIEWGYLDDLLELWDDIQGAKEDLKQDELEPDEESLIKEDIEHCQKEIDDYFSSYKQADKENKVGTFEEEMKKVLLWREEYRKICL